MSRDTRNLILLGILALGLGGVFLIVGTSDAGEPAGMIYSWTTDGGATAMTDDPKRIPVKYRADAIERSLSDVGKTVKLTEMAISADAYAAALALSVERSARLAERLATQPRVEECTGPITVVQERRDYQERGNTYNSLFYVSYDSCGNEMSNTRSDPRPYIEVR